MSFTLWVSGLTRSGRLTVTVLSGLLLGAVEPPGPPTGEVRFGNGRVVSYTIHHDRNSIRDSLRIENSLIALTSSGALLRFELPGIDLTRERIDTEQVTCLGRGEGAAILAGLNDGRVCRVDPTTLNLVDVTKLAAPPCWIAWGPASGVRPAGLVVVTRPTKPVDRDGRHWDVPYVVVHDLATGKTFTLEDDATKFLLDASGRLWLGADRGEWGGRITRVDLVRWTVEAIKPPLERKPGVEAYWQGVYGFIELRDGRVCAYGGTSHMGFNTAYLVQIDREEPNPLLTIEPPDNLEDEPDPSRPRLPITQLIEEDDGLVVFSYSDVFRVDKGLKSWKRLSTLEIQYRWGRPDAVGSYPSVRAVHPPTRPGEPYVLATVGDGYVLMAGKTATSHALPGQLGASSISRIEPSSEGTLFFEWDDSLPVWRFGEKGWDVASLAPPFEIDPANDAADFEKDDGDWSETHVLVGPGGAITTVSGTGVTPGTRTTARRVEGKSVKLGRETSSLNPSSSFLTGDGRLWNLASSELKRFDSGRWETAARLPDNDTPYRLKTIITKRPPWLVLNKSGKSLWQIAHGAQSDDPRLTRVDLREGGKPVRVSDAIPSPDGSLLLATDSGLRGYDPKTQRLSKVDLAEPLRPASVLARDGLGRLWLGGKTGLWMVEAGGKVAESFDRVPWLGRNEVTTLALDASHEGGVIAAMESRGVVFVRVTRKP